MFETGESKSNFLNKTKVARQERASEKDREQAAICLQKYIRKWFKHKELVIKTLQEFDQNLSQFENNKQVTLKSLQVHNVMVSFLKIYKRERDKERMETLCRYLVKSLDSESPSISYIGAGLMKNHYKSWLLQLKKFLLNCMLELKYLNLENSKDYKSTILRLHTLISFTSNGTWVILKTPDMTKLKAGMNQLCSNIMGYLVNNNLYSIMQSLLLKGLCKTNVVLQSIAFTAIATLTMRPLILSGMSDKFMNLFLIHVLSVPALIHHINSKEQLQCKSLYLQNNLFTKCLLFLNKEDNLKLIFNSLKGNYFLCLLANLIELADIENDKLPEEEHFSIFTTIVTNMLISCQQYVVSKRGNTTYWHPILGWFDQPEDPYIQETISLVKKQISYLWTGNIMTRLICEPLNPIVEKESLSGMDQNDLNHLNFFKRTLLESRRKKNNSVKNYRKIGSVETTKIALVCSLYQTALCTLSEIRSIILTGFCYRDEKILYNLWVFLNTLGPRFGIKSILDHLSMNSKVFTPELQMIILLCDCLTHYITILDDIEMYEKQDPFKLNDFIKISNFLNQFIYKAISQSLFDMSTISNNTLFNSMHGLLMAIYRRDCQKKFCPENHWLIKEIKMSNFLSDLEKLKVGTVFLLSKMPHILPHSERVMLFRKYISDEKSTMGLKENSCTSPAYTLITIHRSRIVEDGYRQLAALPSKSLKGIIRVRFVNEQGLHEAGIDQDGVFKEFLEETIKKVFDPSLNLFKSTENNGLYPSSSSYVHENHLQLFEFVGRILGKAVYEGIVVDVPFASFFVSQFCGQAGGVFYSWLDELASLDQDLYRSLTLVKHFEGDVRDLELTFSSDENIMGKLITHELKPGGKAIPVTDENKINYIHLMARFRMYDQIKDQIASFTKGFRSIVNPDWLSLFSTPEWQKLISGDNVPIDLRDLRRNCQYYGGFHDNHRVICWLWDILEKDFSEREKGLFLKFVTSCSKSPLLGFSHLVPPFSIRCVEVGDDEDTGDTIGSVIRGFFTIHKNPHRLPTSSTCFNLLKLPNYQKKSTLREKLRYAIASNTGFELS